MIDESAAERIRILHLEDDVLDAELAATTLTSDGLAVDLQRVDSREMFAAALVAGRFDVILSDYNLPAYDGLTAHQDASRLAPDTPFIFLSGALGEDLAADLLKSGATDFVLKQRIAKLPVAVRRALHESRLRQQSRRAEDEIRKLNADLEARVVERSADLAVTRATLEDREAQLKGTTQRLEAILKYSPHLIQVKDLEGRYILINPAAERVLGAPADAVVGKRPHDVMPPRLADVVHAHDETTIRENRAMHFEETLLQSDGAHIFASTRFPIYDARGVAAGVCDMSLDITAQKHTNDEVKLARLEALRANRAKSDFLSKMSHELRTPLNAILGFAQLFTIDTLTPDQAENVQQILAGGRHLLDLINEVLDITRIESGQLSVSNEPVDVIDVVKSAIELIAPLASASGITVDTSSLPDPSTAVRADRQRLKQVLLNLLSNAVKYNRSNGRVTVGFEVPSPRRFRITVTDTGAGIPPSKLKLLFQPFERLGAENTATEGTGLGLALSRALCEAMEGTLGVQSVVDEGTTFWIELALAELQAIPPDVAAASTAATQQPHGEGTVLYIEDNAANVRLLSRALSRRPKVTLLHAGNGRDGLEMVKNRLPDMVLLDLHLPDMSGEDVLRRLWEDRGTRHIPIVIFTADATPGLARRLRGAGAAAMLNKPLELTQALNVIDRLLNRSVKATDDV